MMNSFTCQFSQHARGFLIFAILPFVLHGCGSASYRLAKTPPSTSSHIAEPAENEAVIVVNNNAIGGTHAGIFAGTRMNDPSGSYVALRHRETKNWPGPSLGDYVDFQKEDGEQILIYRFQLSETDFQTLDARMANASPTGPLFCADEVENLIAGIGPFAGIKAAGWISPSGLARTLDRLTREHAGKCEKPDATAC